MANLIAQPVGGALSNLGAIEQSIDATIDDIVMPKIDRPVGPTPDIFNNTTVDNHNINTMMDVDYEIVLETLNTTLEDRGQSNADYVEKVFSKIIDLGEDQDLVDFVAAANTSESGKNDYKTLDGVINAVQGGLFFVLSQSKDLLSLASGTEIGDTITNALAAGLQSMASNYVDGVTETEYGITMQSSWVGKGQKSFLDTYTQQDALSRKVRIMSSTPLDPGEDKRSAIFGSLIMGVPFTYGSFSDPRNRQFINTFVKDGRIASFTPGFPDYNGGYYMQGSKNAYNQTSSGSEMLDYLLKNGLDSSFTEKDKRFYTFKADYETYYAYLEAMLNPIWLKMGLGTVDNQTFDIFSFFNIKKKTKDGEAGDIDTAGHAQLKNQYKSSIGFFMNGPAGVSESIGSEMTSYGQESSSRVNEASEAYQKINYFTGMGTGSATQNVARTGAIGVMNVKRTMNDLQENFQMAGSWASKGWDFGKKIGSKINTLAGSVMGLAMGAAGLAAGAAIDILSATGSKDLSSIVQSYVVTNGMKVVNPELWSDSNYSKGVNLNFEFMSPYGDPMSIFKYVYVPFCALLCLAMPRAAADNGYVSPFFVRCDIPGHVTSDLAIISDITWTKGGQGNLWTPSGLPRAMSVSVTISDLYPYLAMSKRFSFLSANPSYAVWLDNLAGFCTVYDSVHTDDPLNAYWQRLINRVSGLEASDFSGGLWNRIDAVTKSGYRDIHKKARKSVSARKNGVSYQSIPWMDRV